MGCHFIHFQGGGTVKVQELILQCSSPIIFFLKLLISVGTQNVLLSLKYFLL